MQTEVGVHCELGKYIVDRQWSWRCPQDLPALLR